MFTPFGPFCLTFDINLGVAQKSGSGQTGTLANGEVVSNLRSVDSEVSSHPSSPKNAVGLGQLHAVSFGRPGGLLLREPVAVRPRAP